MDPGMQQAITELSACGHVILLTKLPRRRVWLAALLLRCFAAAPQLQCGPLS